MNELKPKINETYPIIKFPFSIEPYFKGEIPELNTIVPPTKNNVQSLGIGKFIFIILGTLICIKSFSESIALFIMFGLLVVVICVVLIDDIKIFLTAKKNTIESNNKSLENYNRN